MSNSRNNGIKIGDIITAYHKGYHVVVDIETRIKNRHGTDSSIIVYIPILDNHFHPVKKKPRQRCDAHWCNVVTEKDCIKQRSLQCVHFIKGYDTLLAVINERKLKDI